MSPSHTCCRILVPLLALLLVTAPVQARTIYDVEIIVFENVDVPANPNERWRPDVVVPRFDRTAAFDPDDPIGGAFLAELPEAFIELGNDEFRLRDQRRRLEDSSRYRVLRHMGWQQPALDPDEAVALRVRAGEPIEIDIPIRDPGPFGGPMRIDDLLLQGIIPGAGEPDLLDTGRDELRADPVIDGGGDAEREAEPLPATGILPRTRRLSVYPLDGSVRIVVRRYLHVHTDLYFTVPVEWRDSPAALIQADATTPVDLADDESDANGTAVVGTALTRDVAIGADGQPMLSYPIRQQRRMRSRELHYLDHPIVGMLILVTPRDGG